MTPTFILQLAVVIFAVAGAVVIAELTRHWWARVTKPKPKR